MDQRRQTNLSLLEQMRISEFDISHRKSLLDFTDAEARTLNSFQPVIQAGIDGLVAKFYELQTSIAEISLLIGDADTLARLRTAQRRYVLDLFGGMYDLEYVNNRLRIGLVHKRIGVEPKLYLSAVSTLKTLLNEVIARELTDADQRASMMLALEKLLLFDVTLVFETYIRSLVSEIEISKEKSELYAKSLEEKVRERTRQLEEMARTDALTGLLSVRYLNETLTRTLRSAERRSEPVTLVYFDINDFKIINDTQGHQRGDEVLSEVGRLVRKVSRTEDSCFRYGGDEFCLILPNCRAEQAREIYLKRLNIELQECLGDVTLSTGIAQVGPDEYEDAASFIKRVDVHMYAAKKEFKAKRDEVAARESAQYVGP